MQYLPYRVLLKTLFKPITFIPVKQVFFASVFFTGIAIADNVVNAASYQTETDIAENIPQKPALTEVKLADVQSGQLLFKQAENGKFFQAPQLNSKADINVQGIVANAKILQVFKNTTDDWQHALYVFPLPDDAAVNQLNIKLAGREIIGIVQEKQQAKRTFEQAKKSGKKAALLAQLRPNLFSMQVANIPPHETITVELTYFQQVHVDNNQFSLHFPMAITPRYTPTSAQNGQVLTQGESFIPEKIPNLLFKNNQQSLTDEQNSNTLHTIDFSLTLNSGAELAKLKSLNHTVIIEQQKQHHFVMKMHNHPLDKDFELVWQYKNKALPQVLNFTENYQNNTYGLLMVIPEKIKNLTPRDDHPQARQLTFVLDKSGSMAGQSIAQAKQAFKHALSTLNEHDAFQLIIFNNKAESFFEQAVAATSFNKHTAWQHVKQLDADGGTEIKAALALALMPISVSGEPNLNSDELNSTFVKNNKRLEQIVFLTDGAVGNEAEIFRMINQQMANKRLFTVGLGTAPNRYFMKRAAEVGRGSYHFIGSHQQLIPEMKKLFTKLDQPVLTDIKFEMSQNSKGINVNTSPNPIPDLYAGEPIFLSYQSDELLSDKDSALVSATYQGKHWQLPVSLKNTNQVLTHEPLTPQNSDDAQKQQADIPALATLWARRKIADHYRQLMLDKTPSAKQAIIDLALKFNLVTPFTSLVAVEHKVSRPSHLTAKSKQLKNNLPAGQGMPKTALNWQWQLSVALSVMFIGLSFLLICRQRQAVVSTKNNSKP